MWALPLLAAASAPLPVYNPQEYALQEADDRILQAGKEMNEQLDAVSERLGPVSLLQEPDESVADIVKGLNEGIARHRRVQEELKNGELGFHHASFLQEAQQFDQDEAARERRAQLRAQHADAEEELEKNKVHGDEEAIQDTEVKLDQALHARPPPVLSGAPERPPPTPDAAEDLPYSLLETDAKTPAWMAAVTAPQDGIDVEKEERELGAMKREFTRELAEIHVNSPGSLIELDAAVKRASARTMAKLEQYGARLGKSLPASFAELGSPTDFELEETEHAAAAGEKQMRSIQATLQKEEQRLGAGIRQFQDEARSEREEAVRTDSPHSWAAMKLEDSLRKA